MVMVRKSVDVIIPSSRVSRNMTSDTMDPMMIYTTDPMLQSSKAASVAVDTVDESGHKQLNADKHLNGRDVEGAGYGDNGKCVIVCQWCGTGPYCQYYTYCVRKPIWLRVVGPK